MKGGNFDDATTFLVGGRMSAVLPILSQSQEERNQVSHSVPFEVTSKVGMDSSFDSFEVLRELMVGESEQLL